MRIGLFVSSAGDVPLEAVLDRFVVAEEMGFHTAWAGHTLDFDALSVLALASRSTRRIELGTWVVPTYPRHPMALAQQALTVQLACRNRLALGIGTSHAAIIERRMGIDYSRPLLHMTEYLAVLPCLLAGERASFQGEVFRVDGKLDARGAAAPPILLAALGPRMLELAGRCADGAAIWLGGPGFLEDFALPWIDAGARSAGRPRPRILVGLPVAVTREPSARDAAERFLAASSKLPAYRRVLEREGAATPGAVALIGDENQVVERLEALARIGVTDFNAIQIPIDGDPDAIMRTRSTLSSLAAQLTARPRTPA